MFQSIITPDEALGAVEHVAIRAGPDGLHVGMFVRAPDNEAALLDARLAMTDLVAPNAAFAGWEVTDY